MRHHASLLLRLKRDEEAERLARLSMAIAAGENSLDLVAFARELLGKILRKRGATREAMRAYQMALDEARKFGIQRLQCDVLLGLAALQLNLGDAAATRDRAIDALKLANENLLVLRQIKALILLGQAIAERGDVALADCYLTHAQALARDAQFRLAEHDADEAKAALKSGR